MTVPLPNPLTVTETAVLLVLVFFFARWGWRHGIDAVVLAGVFIIAADFFSPQLSKLAATIVNYVYAFFVLLSKGQFSMENLSAVVNGTSAIMPPLANPNDPQDIGYVVITILVFVLISYFAFHYADKKVGGKDPFLESLFGFIGGGALGYICVTFVLQRLVVLPQTVVVQPSEVPQVQVNASLVVVVVMVLIVFGIGRSKVAKKK